MRVTSIVRDEQQRVSAAALRSSSSPGRWRLPETGGPWGGRHSGLEELKQPRAQKGSFGAAVQPGLLSDGVPPLYQLPKAACTPLGGLGRFPIACMAQELNQSSWTARGPHGGQGQGQKWAEHGAQVGLESPPPGGVWIGA